VICAVQPIILLSTWLKSLHSYFTTSFPFLPFGADIGVGTPPIAQYIQHTTLPPHIPSAQETMYPATQRLSEQASMYGDTRTAQQIGFNDGSIGWSMYTAGCITGRVDETDACCSSRPEPSGCADDAASSVAVVVVVSRFRTTAHSQEVYDRNIPGSSQQPTTADLGPSVSMSYLLRATYFEAELQE
jgi:hypothetical protein